MARRAPDGRVRGARARRAARPTRPAGTSASSGSACSAPTAGSGMSWPEEYGGRALHVRAAGDLQRGVRAGRTRRRGSRSSARACSRPTLIQFGTDEQKRRFLPKIQSVEELWCQGFSEPNAGSRPRQHPDPRRARRRRVGDHRSEGVDHARAPRRLVLRRVPHRSRVDRRTTASRTCLCPMDQPGIEVRPLRQMTGSAEFNEVFFDDARTAKENVLGPVGEGWKVAMATLGFERGTAFLSQQLAFEHEFTRAARRRAQARRVRTTRCSATSWPTATSACRSCGSTACACSRTC